MAGALYYAGFVDAGFLKSEGRKALGLSSGRRVGLVANEVVTWIRGTKGSKHVSEEHAFLRAYWYDGAFDPEDQR